MTTENTQAEAGWRRWMNRWRRRLSYLLLPRPDRLRVSNALANVHVYEPVERRARTNSVLRDMEGIYGN